MYVEAVGVGDPSNDDLEAFAVFLSDKIDMTLIGFPIIEHVEDRDLSGTSFVRLWKESNLIIHTWPEKCGGFISVDIYSCKAYDPETVVKEVISFFNPAKWQWRAV